MENKNLTGNEKDESISQKEKDFLSDLTLLSYKHGLHIAQEYLTNKPIIVEIQDEDKSFGAEYYISKDGYLWFY